MHIRQNKIVNRKNQVILLMITDGEKWYYFAVKSMSAVLIIEALMETFTV